MKPVKHILFLLLAIFLILEAAPVWSQPLVDLGPDTTICGGPLLLDAGNPGASYLWNDASTSQTLSVSSSGIYWVEVSDGSGTTRDSVFVEVFPAIAQASIVGDSIICEGETFLLLPSDTMERLSVWFVDTLSEIPISSSHIISNSVSDTIDLSLWQFRESAQPYQTGIDSLIGNWGSTNQHPRGIGIEADRWIFLDSLAVFPQSPGTIILLLQDTNDVTLTSVEYSLQTSGYQKEFIPVNWVLPPGEYRVRASYGGIRLANLPPSSGVSYPIESPGGLDVIYTLLQTGSPFTSSYQVIFDLHYHQLSCETSPVTQRVYPVPNPIPAFPNDTLFCGGSGSLIVPNTGGVSFQWSTGSTTNSTSITNSDTIRLVAVSQACTFSDSTIADVIVPPFASGDSLASCGADTLTFVPGFEGDFSAFYNQDGMQILNDTIYQGIFNNDSTLYYRNAKVGIVQKTLGEALPPAPIVYRDNVPRGLTFDVIEPVILDSVRVFAQGGGSLEIQLWNEENEVVESRVVSANFSSAGVRVPLEFFIDAGTNYKLMLTMISGNIGNLGITAPGNLSQPFPMAIPNKISIIGGILEDGTVSTTAYYYFYDWQVRTNVCASPLVALNVDIEIPIGLPDSIYSCTPFTLNSFVIADNYLWSNGEITPSVFIDSSALISLIASNANGCTVFDTVIATIPRDAGIQDDSILCGNILATAYGDESVFIWNTGDSTSTIIVTDTGFYSVTLTEPRGCQLSDSVYIGKISDFPEVDLGEDQSVCDSTILTNMLPNPAGASFLWNTGASSASISVSSSGQYMITVTNQDGCSTGDTIGVFVSRIPVADFFIEDTVYSWDYSVVLINNSEFGKYLWDFGDGAGSNEANPTHTFSGPGEKCVTLFVSDLNLDCGTDSITRCFQLLQSITSIGEEIIPGFEIRYDGREPSLVLSELSPADIIQLRIIASDGKQILSLSESFPEQGPYPLHQYGMPQGLYVVSIQLKSGMIFSQPFLISE